MSLLPDITTCVPHISFLSDMLLIYTCWAQGCLGIRYLLTTSITQQALLLPFKIHLKRFAGATVQLCKDIFNSGALLWRMLQCLIFFFPLSLFKVTEIFWRYLLFPNAPLMSASRSDLLEGTENWYMPQNSEVSLVIDTTTLLPLQFSPKIESWQMQP